MTYDWEAYHKSKVRGIWPAEYMVRQVFAHHAANLDKQHMTALDIGCGAGANTRLMISEGYDVTATDISPTACAFTAEMWGTLTACGDINTIELQGPYDLIVDNLSLTHVEKPDWDRILGWLKPLGWYIGAFFTHAPPFAPESWDHSRIRNGFSYPEQISTRTGDGWGIIQVVRYVRLP